MELYLERCIESILNQTYKNLEIILVNDGSTDRCGEICDFYKLKDNRIKVIHKSNGGLSEARNYGIEVASGDYLGFVDSDDYIKEDMYQHLVDLIKKYNADISICGTYIAYDNKTIEVYNKQLEVLLSSEDALQMMLKEEKFNTSAWDKLYKKTVFGSIRYPLGKLSEDLFTTYKVFNKAKKIVFSSEPKYFYYQSPNSIMRSNFNPQKLDTLKALEEILLFVELRHPNLVIDVKNRMVRYSTSYLCQIIRYDYQDKELANNLRDNVAKGLKGYLKSKYRFSSKLFSLMLVVNYSISSRIYKWISKGRAYN